MRSKTSVDVPRSILILRYCREFLHEFNKTLEPLSHTADRLIVRVVIIWLLVEKAWKMTH